MYCTITTFPCHLAHSTATNGCDDVVLLEYNLHGPTTYMTKVFVKAIMSFLLWVWNVSTFRRMIVVQPLCELICGWGIIAPFIFILETPHGIDCTKELYYIYPHDTHDTLYSQSLQYRRYNLEIIIKSCCSCMVPLRRNFPYPVLFSVRFIV